MPLEHQEFSLKVTSLLIKYQEWKF
jgi:hypothetical protein